MNKFGTFVLGTIAGAFLMHQIDTYKPIEHPKAIFNKSEIQLLETNRTIDSVDRLDPSTSNYTVNINKDSSDSLSERLIPITADNLYYSTADTKSWYKANQSWEKLLDNEKFLRREYHRNIIAKGILYQDTIREISDNNLYIGFDGLGYVRPQK